MSIKPAQKLNPELLELFRDSTLGLYLEGSEPTVFARGQVRHLAHAELLLLRSARTITQVAQDCGFVDVSHLIRVFKTARGITPEVWRRRQGNPDLASDVKV